MPDFAALGPDIETQIGKYGCKLFSLKIPSSRYVWEITKLALAWYT